MSKSLKIEQICTKIGELLECGFIRQRICQQGEMTGRVKWGTGNNNTWSRRAGLVIYAYRGLGLLDKKRTQERKGPGNPQALTIVSVRAIDRSYNKAG